jgi:hypothetical protein
MREKKSGQTGPGGDNPGNDKNPFDRWGQHLTSSVRLHRLSQSNNTKRSALALILLDACLIAKTIETLLCKSTIHVYEVRPRKDKRGVDLLRMSPVGTRRT